MVDIREALEQVRVNESSSMERKAIEQIADKFLDIKTLTVRNSDKLDFHKLSVATIGQALTMAYRAGQADKK